MIRFMFKALIRPVLFFLLVLTSVSTFAQQKWTLEDCIDYALDNNLDIKRQIQMVQSYKANLLQSALSMLPDLNANASNAWNWGQTIDQFTNEFATSRVLSNNFNIQSNMILFNGLQKFNTVKQNKIDLLASNYDLDVLKNDISLAVAGYYLDILFNLEILDVAANQLNITREQVVRVEKMVEAGSSAKGDLLNIQAQASAEELTVVESENRLNISKLSLQQLIDLPVTKDFTIEKPILKPVEAPKEFIDADIIYAHALNTRPEIKSYELKVQSAEKSLAIAKGAQSPSLSVGFSYGTGYSGARQEVDPNIQADTIYKPIGFTENTKEIVLSPMISNSYRITPFADQLNDNDNATLGFYLRIPIFNGWQVRSGISQAKIQRTIANINYEQEKRTLRKTIEQAYADAVAALKKYKSAHEKVKAQEESFKYTEQKFEVGMLTSFDYNNTKKELTAAQSELLQAKYDFIFKTTILDFYMGNPIRIN